MTFTHENQKWTVERAKGCKVVDCRLPKASAVELAGKLNKANPQKIELLDKSVKQDFLGKFRHTWNFRITVNGVAELVNIPHRPDLTVREKYARRMR